MYRVICQAQMEIRIANVTTNGKKRGKKILILEAIEIHIIKKTTNETFQTTRDVDHWWQRNKEVNRPIFECDNSDNRWEK